MHVHEIHVHTNTCAHIQENMQAEEASWEEKEWELEEGKRGKLETIMFHILYIFKCYRKIHNYVCLIYANKNIS